MIHDESVELLSHGFSNLVDCKFSHLFYSNTLKTFSFLVLSEDNLVLDEDCYLYHVQIFLKIFKQFIILRQINELFFLTNIQ